LRWGILVNLSVILVVSGMLLFVVFSVSLERAAIDAKMQETGMIVDLLQNQVLAPESAEKMWENVRNVCRGRTGLRLSLYDSHGKLLGGCALKNLRDKPFSSEPGRKVRLEGIGWPTGLFQGMFLIVDVTGPFKHGVHHFRASIEIPPSVFAPAWKFFGAYLVLTQSALFFLGYILFHRTVIGPISDAARLAGKAAGIADPDFAQSMKLKGDIHHISATLRGLISKSVDDREKMEALIEKLQTANRNLEAAQQGLIRSEKLAGVGRLAAGLAHEVGNPVQILMGYVELLQRAPDTHPHSEILSRMEQEIERIHAILQMLLDFARPIRKHIAACDVNALVKDCADLIKGRKGFRNFDLEYMLDPELPPIETEPEKIRQIVVNLLFNAADAIPDTGGKIVIQTRTQGESIEIDIRDTGSGIPEADLERIFDPFFTTKEPGKGTGLGLAVCLGHVESLGGEIKVESAPGEGTTVRVILKGIDVQRRESSGP
jgi:two-component system, NtrC family, sensor kinase